MADQIRSDKKLPLLVRIQRFVQPNYLRLVVKTIVLRFFDRRGFRGSSCDDGTAEYKDFLQKNACEIFHDGAVSAGFRLPIRIFLFESRDKVSLRAGFWRE